jgi:hypothetical protein
MGKQSGSRRPREIAFSNQLFNPLPPPAGGRGKGEGGRSEIVAAVPTSPSPAQSRRGPSLSPLKGGEGLLPFVWKEMLRGSHAN